MALRGSFQMRFAPIITPNRHVRMRSRGDS